MSKKDDELQIYKDSNKAHAPFEVQILQKFCKKQTNCHASFSCFKQWRRNPTEKYVRRAKKMIEYNSTYEDEVVVEIRRQKTKNEPFVDDKTKNNRKQCRLQ